MKRTKERTEIEIENEERQAIYANHITPAMRDQGYDCNDIFMNSKIL